MSDTNFSQASSSGSTTFSPEEAYKKLTRKQKVFVKHLIDNPTSSGKEAAMKAYNTTTDLAARSIASENLTKPNILAVLQGYDQIAQETIAELALQREDKRLAFDASKDILDRIHGKATQNIKSTSVTAAITLDLTGGNSGDIPPEVMEQLNA
jgi:hypothetical protein